MKKSLLMMLIAGCSGVATAADFVDTAKVVSSTPIYERISDPKQECWIETVGPTGDVSRSAPVEERSIGGALLGGLIGGVVGSQIGDGNGSTVATGVGALAGAIIGDRVGNEDQGTTHTQRTTRPREERHCRQIENYRDVVRGYDVTYEYGGRNVTVRMPTQPGDTVRVGVSVLIDSTVVPAPAARPYDRRDRRDWKRYDD